MRTWNKIFLTLFLFLSLSFLSSPQHVHAESPVKVLSHSSFSDSGYFWVFGEVQNTGVTKLVSVEVNLVYYDRAGGILGTERHNVLLSVLEPGQKSPFIVWAGMTHKDPINPSLVERYSVNVEDTTVITESITWGLKILNERTLVDKDGYFHVSGEIKNNASIPFNQTWVVATFYDINGTVVDVNWSPTGELNTLQPKEFDIVSHKHTIEDLNAIDHYSLQAISYTEEAMISCIVSPEETYWGETVTASGSIIPQLEGVSIHIRASTDGVNYVSLANVTSVIGGNYIYTWAPTVGVHYLEASWITEDGSQSKSSVQTLTVYKMQSSVSCQVSTTEARTSDPVTVSGTLSPVIGSTDVSIVLTRPDGSNIYETITTSPDGTFSHTYSPEVSGEWRVRVDWEGDTEHEGYTGTEVSVSVTDPVQVVRDDPSVEDVVLGVSAGATLSIGITYLLNMSNFGQAFSSAVSRLPLPSWLYDLLMDYTKDLFEVVSDKKKRKELEEKPFLTVKEMITLAFLMFSVTMVFGYVEANGLPYFIDPVIFIKAVTFVFLSSVVIICAETMFNSFSTKLFSVRAEINVWLIGLFSFLVSGLVFMVPFSSPYSTKYQSGEIPKEKQGLIILSSKLFVSALLLPFSALHMFNYETIGDAGSFMILMRTCYSLIPVAPMAGRVVFDYDKRVWLLYFAASSVLYVGWSLRMLPHYAYLVGGFISAIACALTLYKGTRAQPDPSESIPADQ